MEQEEQVITENQYVSVRNVLIFHLLTQRVFLGRQNEPDIKGKLNSTWHPPSPIFFILLKMWDWILNLSLPIFILSTMPFCHSTWQNMVCISLTTSTKSNAPVCYYSSRILTDTQCHLVFVIWIHLLRCDISRQWKCTVWCSTVWQILCSLLAGMNIS